MATQHSLALQCGAVPSAAATGWRERLQRAWHLLRWRRPLPAAAVAPVDYGSLAGLDAHLLADIGAPESLRDRARHGHELQRQRVIDFELGHRSIGEGRW